MIGKVVSLKGKRDTEILEFEVPSVGPGAAMLKVLRTNICGSDIHLWEGKYPISDRVIGHELVGEIYELGEGVTTDYNGVPVKAGDRVVPCYYIACMKCENCKNGLFNNCLNGSNTANQKAAMWPHFTGSFATHYYIEPGQHFYKIPDSISDDVAAGINCGITQILYSLHKARITVGSNLAVIGAGGLGLYACAIAHEAGATVTVIDAVESRLNHAKQFGADYTINLQEYDTIEKRCSKIKELMGPADIVLEVAGRPEAFVDALYYVRAGGTVLELGNVLADAKHQASIIPGMIVRKCINVKGVLRYDPWYLQKTIDFLEKHQHKYPFEQLSDKLYSLNEVQEALEKSAARTISRAIIAPWKDL